MVAKELLEELRSTRWNFEWQYDGRSRKIRGQLKSQPDGRLFDPIGAVCYCRTGLVFNHDDWFQAAEAIELSHIDAADLTAAANNVSSHSDYVHHLRHEMADELLLQPEKEGTALEVPESIMGFLTTLFRGDTSSGMTSSRT